QVSLLLTGVPRSHQRIAGIPDREEIHVLKERIENTEGQQDQVEDCPERLELAPHRPGGPANAKQVAIRIHSRFEIVVTFVPEQRGQVSTLDVQAFNADRGSPHTVSLLIAGNARRLI